MYFFGLVR